MVQDEIFFDPTGAPLAAHASGALHVQDIMCLRGSHCLFDGFSLTLDPGAALAVYGANGAGKTSLLRLIAGLVPIQAGAVTLQAAPDGCRCALCRPFGRVEKCPARLGNIAGLCRILWPRRIIRVADQAFCHCLGVAVPTGRLVNYQVRQRRRLALARLLPVARPLVA